MHAAFTVGCCSSNLFGRVSDRCLGVASRTLHIGDRNFSGPGILWRDVSTPAQRAMSAGVVTVLP